MTEILNHRAQQILKSLIERYIQDGTPIGSKTLADECALGVSSATIRNILGDLESEGYLTSPHTSAGRIPTAMGYRLFVNQLLTVKPLQGNEVQEVKSQLHSDLNLTNLLDSASTILSSFTNMIGVVTLPKRNRVALKQIEFLPLSGHRVLVILVLNNREVQNRILNTDRSYTHQELQSVSNYLNSHCAGKDLLSVRKELADALQRDRDSMRQLIQSAMDVADKALDGENKEYIVAGRENILHYMREVELTQLRAMFDAFAQKQEVFNLLNQAFEAEGVQIFIGKEAGYGAFEQCSVVTASYSSEGQHIGTLAVIGPTRMPYDRVISVVEVTSKLLSDALRAPL